MYVSHMLIQPKSYFTFCHQHTNFLQNFYSTYLYFPHTTTEKTNGRGREVTENQEREGKQMTIIIILITITFSKMNSLI